MLKLLQIIGILILTFNNAIAQTEIHKRINDFSKYNFGIYIAPNFSWLNTVIAQTTDNFNIKNEGGRTGFSYGLLADVNFKKNNNYSFITGINILSGGGTLGITNSGLLQTDKLKATSITYNLQYLDIPIGLKLKSALTPKITGFIETGLDLGINLQKKFKFNSLSVADSLGNNSTALKYSLDYQRLTGLRATPMYIAFRLGVGGTYNINQNLKAYFGLVFINAFIPDITYPEKGMPIISGLKSGKTEVDFNDGKQRLNGIQARFGLYF